jgi:hypothetical protein
MLEQSKVNMLCSFPKERYRERKGKNEIFTRHEYLMEGQKQL